jgi:hypothetical protein
MGKQYAILRVQKCKGAEIGAMQYHNDREPGKHTNPDIDQSRTRLNREMCLHADYEGEIQARIDAGYKAPAGAQGCRETRRGHRDGKPGVLRGRECRGGEGLLRGRARFCREEFGGSNLVHFTVHMDEETPHAHFGSCR